MGKATTLALLMVSGIGLAGEPRPMLPGRMH